MAGFRFFVGAELHYFLIAYSPCCFLLRQPERGPRHEKEATASDECPHFHTSVLSQKRTMVHCRLSSLPSPPLPPATYLINYHPSSSFNTILLTNCNILDHLAASSPPSILSWSTSSTLVLLSFGTHLLHLYHSARHRQHSQARHCYHRQHHNFSFWFNLICRSILRILESSSLINANPPTFGSAA